MRQWLRETHGPNFELLRHFVLRFFDSELTDHARSMEDARHRRLFAAAALVSALRPAAEAQVHALLRYGYAWPVSAGRARR